MWHLRPQCHIQDQMCILGVGPFSSLCGETAQPLSIYNLLLSARSALGVVNALSRIYPDIRSVQLPARGWPNSQRVPGVWSSLVHSQSVVFQGNLSCSMRFMANFPELGRTLGSLDLHVVSELEGSWFVGGN
jgi:hypothetical protein